MAALNDLLAVYTPTRDVTANKIQLMNDLGGDQDTVYANLLAATGLTRATASFNDALHAYLEAYQPLGMFDWKAAFYAGDPLFVPPADGGAVAAWRNGGSTRTEGAYLSTSGLTLPGTAGNFASVDDEAALDITGDITLVSKVTLTDWTPAAITAVGAKATLASIAYVLVVNTDGTLSVITTADGTTQVSGTSTAAVSAANGSTKWVAGTLDVNNGASGRDYTFWTSDDGVTWTQLGSTVTEGATTSIVSNSTPFYPAGVFGQAVYPLTGSVQRSQVWSGSSFTTAGPGGTKVLDIDFTGRADVNKFTCSTGQTVTVTNTLDASQATGTKQPAYRASVAALNDKPAVQGDGIDDFLQTAAWSSALTQPNSVVIVGSIGTTGNVSLFDGVGANRQRILNDSGNTVLFAGSFVGSTAASTAPALYVAVFDSTDTLDRNGTQIASGAAGAASLGGITIGAFPSTLTGCHTGHYAFVGAIAGDITADANWPAFVAWVESTYGLTVA